MAGLSATNHSGPLSDTIALPFDRNTLNHNEKATMNTMSHKIGTRGHFMKAPISPFKTRQQHITS